MWLLQVGCLGLFYKEANYSKNESTLNRNLIIGIICVIIVTVVIVISFIVIPMSQPHNPETIAWLNQAECDELLDWINERKGTLEKYQSTAKGIYDYKECRN